MADKKEGNLLFRALRRKVKKKSALTDNQKKYLKGIGVEPSGLQAEKYLKSGVLDKYK